MGFQMGDKTQAMDPGISAAAALDVHLTTKKSGGGLEQTTLNRFGVLLLLPAAVTAAVKFQNQLEALWMDVH